MKWTDFPTYFPELKDIISDAKNSQEFNRNIVWALFRMRKNDLIRLINLIAMIRF